MRSKLIVMIVLTILIGVSAVPAFAVDHWVRFWDRTQQHTQEGVLVTIYVLTAPGVWSERTATSDAGGFVHYNVDQHTTATYWKMTLNSAEDPFAPNTYNWTIYYPTEHVEWLLDRD